MKVNKSDNTSKPGNLPDLPAFVTYLLVLPGLLVLSDLLTFVTSFTDIRYLIYWLPLPGSPAFVT